MVDSVRMTEAQLGARLRADAKGVPKAVFQAMFSAAQRGKAFLVEQSPVDRGILRNAWKILRLISIQTVELTNDQPYAGIVERGSKPFKISQEGIQALKGWAMRKLQSGEMMPTGAQTKITWARGWDKKHRQAKGESLIKSKRKKRFSKQQLEQEAQSIAYAIAKKFERIGMKGQRFVMKNLGTLASLMDAEVKRYLSKFFNRRVQEGSGDG
jgi:hypothetical protein